MNKQEHLISRLAEESIEVAKECLKANSFGINDNYTGKSVKKKIIHELNDLFAVIEMLQDEGALPMIIVSDRLIESKKRKVIKFMKYAHKKGTLTK